MVVAGCVVGCAVLVTLALSQANPAALVHERETADDPPSRVRPLPADRGGQESIGEPWPERTFDRRIMTNPDDPLPDPPRDAVAAGDGPPPVTLYRWWTNGCRFCASSLPAIETWRKRYASRGLRVVAVYHPKPPRDVSDAFVRRAAETIGYAGEIAIDDEWAGFQRVTRSWAIRGATSVSFLVDHTGTIRFVHPGPDFYPPPDDGDDDHVDAQARRQHRDHARLEAAIESLLHDRTTAIAAAQRDDADDVDRRKPNRRGSRFRSAGPGRIDHPPHTALHIINASLNTSARVRNAKKPTTSVTVVRMMLEH